MEKNVFSKNNLQKINMKILMTTIVDFGGSNLFTDLFSIYIKI